MGDGWRATVPLSVHEFEMTDEYVTWVGHLMDQEPLVIPDVEAIKESCPKEYEAYQRLDSRAVIGVPFGQHPQYLCRWTALPAFPESASGWFRL